MTTRMPSIETERLLIRELAVDDLDAVHHVLNESFGDEPLEQRRTWLQWTVLNYECLGRLYQPPYGDRAVVRKVDGVLVGTVGFVPSYAPVGLLPSFTTGTPADALHQPAFGMFWAVGAAYRGQGYASEAARAMVEYAFTHLRLKRIVATTEHDNAASMAVMRHIGMRVERNTHAAPPYFQVMGWLENPVTLI